MSKIITVADVFELIEPVDPDSIRAEGGNEFLLNWLKGGFTSEQLEVLRANEKITILVGPYQPREEPAITQQIRIKVS